MGLSEQGRLAMLHAETRARRVCILIPTYKRPEALQRVVSQTLDFVQKYCGCNRYEVCVTDSDATGAIARQAGVQYFVNPGVGFDENLFYFWRDRTSAYDYVFTISDDDLFAPWINPLYLLDAAIESAAEVFMFNHRGYKLQADGTIELGPVLYRNVDLLFDRSLLLRELLTMLPRHIATLYSTRRLREVLPKLFDFRRTLHLYAVPILLAAAEGKLKFSDHVLCLYNLVEKTDGAWTVGEDVLNGLADFLRLLKRMVAPDMYAIAEAGFFCNYLGAESELRLRMAGNPLLMSEQEIREMLSAAPGCDDAAGAKL